MKPWSNTRLSIDLETVAVNDKTMSLQILYNNRICWQQKPLAEGFTTWSQDIVLPSTVTLVFGNRLEHSTIVDDQGKIIKNMSIIIKSIKLDNLPCWPYYLNDLVTDSDSSDEIFLGPTICTNGKMDIIFNENSAFHWIVKTKPN